VVIDTVVSLRPLRFGPQAGGGTSLAGPAGLLMAAGRTEGLDASWSPDVPGPGMTGCCQLAQPARWVSVTWLTPPLSACRHSTPAACFQRCWYSSILWSWAC